MGIRGGNRRREGPVKRKKVGRRHNGIPLNPYEQIDEESDEQYDEDTDLVPFEGQDFEFAEVDRDGKVFNASGERPQQP